MEKKKKHGGWNLEGETDVPETRIFADAVEGTNVDLDGEGHQRRGQVKNHTEVKVVRQVKKVNKLTGRKIIWVEINNNLRGIREQNTRLRERKQRARIRRKRKN